MSQVLIVSLVWLFIAALVGYVGFDAGYERGYREGGDEVHSASRMRLFSALREKCNDPLASKEQRSGAWRVVQKAVRP